MKNILRFLSLFLTMLMALVCICSCETADAGSANRKSDAYLEKVQLVFEEYGDSFKLYDGYESSIEYLVETQENSVFSKNAEDFAKDLRAVLSELLGKIETEYPAFRDQYLNDEKIVWVSENESRSSLGTNSALKMRKNDINFLFLQQYASLFASYSFGIFVKMPDLSTEEVSDFQWTSLVGQTIPENVVSSGTLDELPFSVR